MDRRDALKKLGMGGATIVGVSMIVSTPAFASPGTEADVATAVTGFVRVVRTGSNRDTTFALQNVLVSCPQSGGSYDLASVAWFNGVTGVDSTSVREPNGSSSYTRRISFRVRCSDRNGLDVCAAYTGQFSYSHSGNRVNTNAPLSTVSLGYVPCP